jgi:PAS domain S-box-containing protein
MALEEEFSTGGKMERRFSPRPIVERNKRCQSQIVEKTKRGPNKNQFNQHEPSMKPIRVLIVEDSEEDTLLIVRELRRTYDPLFERVATPAAMGRALEKYWDVIISDFSMPGFDGLDALRLLQKSKLDIPFIIVSGAIGEEVAVHVMKAGASDYVMKDKMARLVPAIERELREAEARLERRRAEMALAHLAAIVESSDDAIIGMALDGTVLSWNFGAEKIYGYSADEAVGHRISLVAPPVSAGEIPQIFDRIKNGERVEGYETIRVKKDGTPIDVSLTISPIKNSSGKITGISAIERDITEQKRVESERKRLIEELSQALTKVKTLSGLLPICASCKKIRDDKGYWQQVETFIKARSDADFSHGICPDCIEKLYPEFAQTM